MKFRRNKYALMDEKVHFKMYKSGKIWVVAGITTFGFILGLGAGSVSTKAETQSIIAKDQASLASNTINFTNPNTMFASSAAPKMTFQQEYITPKGLNNSAPVFGQIRTGNTTVLKYFYGDGTSLPLATVGYSDPTGQMNPGDTNTSLMGALPNFNVLDTKTGNKISNALYDSGRYRGRIKIGINNDMKTLTGPKNGSQKLWYVGSEPTPGLPSEVSNPELNRTLVAKYSSDYVINGKTYTIDYTQTFKPMGSYVDYNIEARNVTGLNEGSSDPSNDLKGLFFESDFDTLFEDESVSWPDSAPMYYLADNAGLYSKGHGYKLKYYFNSSTAPTGWKSPNYAYSDAKHVFGNDANSLGSKVAPGQTPHKEGELATTADGSDSGYDPGLFMIWKGADLAQGASRNLSYQTGLDKDGETDAVITLDKKTDNFEGVDYTVTGKIHNDNKDSLPLKYYYQIDGKEPVEFQGPALTNSTDDNISFIIPAKSIGNGSSHQVAVYTINRYNRTSPTAIMQLISQAKIYSKPVFLGVGDQFNEYLGFNSGTKADGNTLLQEELTSVSIKNLADGTTVNKNDYGTITQKPGSYEITYTYNYIDADKKPQTISAKSVVTVLAKPTMEVEQQITVVAGDQFDEKAGIKNGTDENGKLIDKKKVTVTFTDASGNKVTNPTATSGDYTINYDYSYQVGTETKHLNKTSKLKVLAGANIAAEKTAVIVAGDPLDTKTLITSATDENGKPLDKDSVKVTITSKDGKTTVTDITKAPAGEYTISYDYVYTVGTEDRHAQSTPTALTILNKPTMTVEESHTIVAGDTLDPKASITGTDEHGATLDKDKVKVTITSKDGKTPVADITKAPAGDYTIHYDYEYPVGTGKGNVTATSSVKVLVGAKIEAEKTAVIVAGNPLDTEALITSATDENGSQLDKDSVKVTITSKDGKTPVNDITQAPAGEYTISYDYKYYAGTAEKHAEAATALTILHKPTMTVEESHTIVAGDTLDPKASIVGTDEHGAALNKDKVTVTIKDEAGNVITDLSKAPAGDYTIDYDYGYQVGTSEGHQKATSKVTVLKGANIAAEKTAVIVAGDTLDPKTLITSATDENGKPLDKDSVKVTITSKDGKTPVNDITQAPAGEYTISYDYKYYAGTAEKHAEAATALTILHKPTMTVEESHTIVAGDTLDPKASITGTDEHGATLDKDKVKVTITSKDGKTPVADITKAPAGDYTIHYDYEYPVGTGKGNVTATSSVKVLVGAKIEAEKTAVIVAGDPLDTEALITSATDENGSQLDKKSVKVTITSKDGKTPVADITKAPAGDYTISYDYKYYAGTAEKHAEAATALTILHKPTMTVEESHTIVAGDPLDPKTLITSATDENGNQIDKDKVKVTITSKDGKTPVADITKAPAGDYTIHYDYEYPVGTGKGNVTATSDLKVLSKPGIQTKPQKIYVGDPLEPKDGFVGGTDENNNELTKDKVKATVTDTDGNEIKDINNIKAGSYEVRYEYDSGIGSGNGKISKTDKLEIIERKHITLNYVDQNGNPIDVQLLNGLKNGEQSGPYGSELGFTLKTQLTLGNKAYYEFEKAKIEGTTETDLSKLKFGDDNIVVTLTYKGLSASSINVEFKDVNDASATFDKANVKGNAGDKLDVSKITLPNGYHVASDTELKGKGKDKDGNPINLKQPDVSFKNGDDSTIVYVVGNTVKQSDKNAVTVHYYLQDKLGNNTTTSVLPDSKIGGRVGQKVTASAATAPDGYEVVPGQEPQDWVLKADEGKAFTFYYKAATLHSIGVDFVNAKTGKTIVNNDQPAGKTGDILDLSSNSDYIKGKMPKGYHYSTPSELNGKTQPENLTYTTTSQKATVYITGESDESIEIAFVDIDSGETLNTNKPTGYYTGDTLDLTPTSKEIAGKIPEGYHYATEKELSSKSKSQPANQEYDGGLLHTVIVYIAASKVSDDSESAVTIHYYLQDKDNKPTEIQIRPDRKAGGRFNETLHLDSETETIPDGYTAVPKKQDVKITSSKGQEVTFYYKGNARTNINIEFKDTKGNTVQAAKTSSKTYYNGNSLELFDKDGKFVDQGGVTKPSGYEVTPEAKLKALGLEQPTICKPGQTLVTVYVDKAAQNLVVEHRVRSINGALVQGMKTTTDVSRPDGTFSIDVNEKVHRAPSSKYKLSGYAYELNNNSNTTIGPRVIPGNGIITVRADEVKDGKITLIYMIR
ncbi:bacterial Ig-like domain-containing protein [Xylocopilactobacillus apis]|uniref:Ig-like domain-containing protein n=1 Tax=Xylocopilactobacillus apis TaxID=2932183 RepID=A0AAU9D4W9_9LACO|nr:bacterial Ig-like domain-containing protein [Xylocopilactobacillus apis]BDR57536.1 hypothetical protein KIMC2_20980 [Xylocopilactobacillus apis]